MTQLATGIEILKEDATPHESGYLVHLGTPYGPLYLDVWRDPKQLDDNDSRSSKTVIMMIGSPRGRMPVTTTQPFVINGIPYYLSDALLVGCGNTHYYWDNEHFSAVQRLNHEGHLVDTYEDEKEDAKTVKDREASRIAREFISAIHAAIPKRWYVLAEERRVKCLHEEHIAITQRRIQRSVATLLELTPDIPYADALRSLLKQMAETT